MLPEPASLCVGQAFAFCARIAVPRGGRLALQAAQHAALGEGSGFVYIGPICKLRSMRL